MNRRQTIPAHRRYTIRNFNEQFPTATITAHGAAHIYQRWTERWHIRERFTQPDWSIVDLGWLENFLAMQVSTTQVEAILRLGSPHFPRHHGDPEGYLRRTLARAALPPPRPVCSTQATAPTPAADDSPAPVMSRDN